jgi:uncharacterized protein
MDVHAVRLMPGEDLKKSIQQFVTANNIQAGWITSSVGSLTVACIRFANATEGKVLRGPFEIISLNGTVSANGSHLHIAISDAEGRMLGGHLLDGCIIYTTAEIVIGSTDKYRFERKPDGSTGYAELQIMEQRT